MARALQAGSAFAGLTIEELLAAGGMGSVYRATDVTLQRPVALKVVAEALADDPVYRARFLAEARLAASLEHPAIVPVYGAGESDGQLYLSMRFMEDGSLADLLDRSGPLAAGDAARLLGPIADALDTAHRNGLVHRDVKPGNVLLQGDRAYLADFGLAMSSSPSESRLSRHDPDLSGTMGYLSPEQIEGDQASASSDQYALACVLFQCLTNRKPFARDNDLAVIYAHLQEPPPSLLTARPDLPSAVDAVVARGLAKRPDQRYGSCRELVDAFDAAIRAVPTVRDGPRPRQRRRRGAAAVLAGTVALVVAALVLASFARSSNDAAPPPGGGDGVAVIDPTSGTVSSRIPVGSGPLAVAAGAGSVWVVNADSRTISRIDAKSREVTGPPFAVTEAPIGLAYGEGALWVSTGSRYDKIDFGTITDSVVRIDPATNLPGDPIRLVPGDGVAGFHRGGNQIAAGGGSVWVVDSGGSIERIDPLRQSPSLVPGDGYKASAVAFGDGAAWVLGEQVDDQGNTDGPFVWSIDPKTFARSKPVRIAATGASDLTVGAGSVWVASPWDGLVFRMTPSPQNPVSTIPVAGATALTYDAKAGVVWVVDPVDGSMTKLDPKTGQAGPPIRLSGAPQAVAVAAGAVFASVISANSGSVVSREPGAGDVHVQGCSAVLGDPASPPDMIVVGDFPLDSSYSRSDSDAVEQVLREHHFRAGGHSVGYQSCDDPLSTDDAQCIANGEAYAQSARVVAVITGFLSRCADAQLPSLRDAKGGAIAAIGPVNTADTLTAGAYPNYVRVTPTDSDHTAADVGVFLEAKAHKVYVVSQRCDCPYIPGVADLFRSLSAGKLDVVGSQTFDVVDGPSVDEIAADVGRSGADAVYLVGFPQRPTGDMLEALRAVDPHLVIVAPDAIIPVSDLIGFAADAATGVLVTQSNAPNGALPLAGRQWLRRFAATRLGGQVPTSSAMAAAATEALLDAIGRSDGTRASIVTKLRTTDLPNSVIGPVQFTQSGDIEACAISVYRIVGGTAFVPDVQSDLQGATFLRRTACPAR